MHALVPGALAPLLRTPAGAVLVGGSGLALALAGTVPQVVRLRRTGTGRGLSGTAVAVTVAMDLGWLGYSVGRARWFPAAADVLYLLVAAACAVLLARAGGLARRDAGAGAGVLGALALVAVAGQVTGRGLVPLGLVLACQQLVSGGPALAAAYRSPRVTGLSPAAAAGAVASGGWLVGYGALLGDGPFLLCGSLTAGVQGLLLVRWWWVEQRVPRLALA